MPCKPHEEGLFRSKTFGVEGRQDQYRLLRRYDDPASAGKSLEGGSDHQGYLFLDARYDRVREASRLVDCAVLVAVGISPDGKRRLVRRWGVLPEQKQVTSSQVIQMVLFSGNIRPQQSSL